MRQDLLKTGRPLVDDDQPVGSDRLSRPDSTGLVGSRHARLSDQMEAPDDDLSLQEAESLCAEVTRAWLGDFAPALVLLDSLARRRLQAVVTLVRTAVDFCLQPGVEGERVAALSRLQFEVEAALDGDPRGQPAHLLIADEQASRSWKREAWDRLFDRLRHLAMLGVLTPERADRLGDAVAELLQAGGPTGTALTTVLRRAEGWRLQQQDRPARERRADSESAQDDAAVHATWRRFSAYIHGADKRLAVREARGRRVRLGLLARLGLLLRARYG